MSFDQMQVIENLENVSIESVKKLDKNSTLMESKNSDLCPITPYLTEEKVKVASRNDVLSTPVEDVFDMCVSGSNQKNNLGTSAAKKKLVFSPNECDSENECENGSLMETVYESVLEDIICKQAEDILAEILVSGSSCCDMLKTPPSAARADGFVETCPGAPMKRKQVRNKKTVDMSLCRKLDFDSCV